MRQEALHSQPVVILAGPTASGKSQMALDLCVHLAAQGKKAEILCADSITVYRNLEIGAAKPSRADQNKVPHHLLNLRDPDQEFTASDFVQEASQIIQRLHDQNILPLLVGGTGFYLRALVQGMAAEGKEDRAQAEAIKKKILEKAALVGWEGLYKELIALDPGAPKTVHPNDHYRIQRALQAMEMHGGTWSELNAQARSKTSKYPGLRFFVLRMNRELLQERIRERTNKMLAEGLVNEVSALLASGISPAAKPLQSVGYKETVDFLNGNLAEERLAERIIQETQRLAKRQQTWFQSEKSVEWIENLSELKAALMLN